MTTTEANITITENPDVSINDLVALQNRGFSVLRSAHVGNMQPYNLALAAAGIQMLCVDHTITGVDKNYFPELISNVNTENERTLTVIAPPNLLTSRTIATQIPNSLGLVAKSGEQYVDQIHMASLRLAVPDTNAFTNTEYLRANEPIANEIIKISLAVSPYLFNRAVSSTGSVFSAPNAAERVARNTVLQLQDDPRTESTAILIPNEVNIVANFVIESLLTGCATQYHLSGPDMVNYIDKIQPELNKLYTSIKSIASFRRKLPDVLDVQLVPTIPARFVTIRSNKLNIDALLEASFEYDEVMQQTATERSMFFNSPASQDQNLSKQKITAFKQREQTSSTFASTARNKTPELFVVPKTPNYYTQYDVMQHGLYVPEINNSLTMSELKHLFQRIKKLKDYKP